MLKLKDEEIRQTVRESYGEIAQTGAAGCGCSCGGADSGAPRAERVSAAIGYSPDDLTTVPDGANLGLGCGNPQAIASLRPGETVLDLGSGAGFDCFLAARAVGPSGRVIGVDMTPEMIHKARENAAGADLDNVEFRAGEIEHLPVADATVDVIISNCVINLSPEKTKVFAEAFRALKSGGRLAIADVVATAPLPEAVKQDLALYAGCMAGAVQIDEVEAMLAAAGFVDVRVEAIDASRELAREWLPDRQVADYVVSATIEATKP